MGFKVFGNCLNEIDIRPRSGWPFAPLFSGGFLETAQERYFCRYTYGIANNPERAAVVLCTGRDSKAGQIGVNCALEEGLRILKRWANSPGRDPYPLLSDMVYNWQQRVMEESRQEGMRISPGRDLGFFAPGFLAAVGTEHETFFVQCGGGSIFYKRDGRLQQKVMNFRTAGRGSRGFFSGGDKIFCGRVPGVPEAVFMVAAGDSEPSESDLGRFLNQAARMSSRIFKEEILHLLEEAGTDRKDEAVFAAAGFYVDPLSDTARSPSAFREEPLLRQTAAPKSHQFWEKKRKKELRQKQEALQALKGQLLQAEQEKERLESHGDMIREQLRRLEEDYESVQRRLEKNEKYIERKEEQCRAGDEG